MFESIRDKLFPSSSVDTSLKIPEDIGECNLNAGAALLERYQNDWNRMHVCNEANAKKAEEVDKRICVLNDSCERHWDRVGGFLTQLNSLPAAQEDLRNVIKKLGELENGFQELEKALLYLENTIEIQEMQVKQLDDRFDLTIYTERRRADFENTRERLAMQHENRVIRFEAEKKEVLHERQEVFQEAFDGDMEYYKKHGKIEKVNSTRSNEENLKLEDVELEQVCDDLDVFLGSETVEESSALAGTDGAEAEEGSSEEGNVSATTTEAEVDSEIETRTDVTAQGL